VHIFDNLAIESALGFGLEPRPLPPDQDTWSNDLQKVDSSALEMKTLILRSQDLLKELRLVFKVSIVW